MKAFPGAKLARSKPVGSRNFRWEHVFFFHNHQDAFKTEGKTASRYLLLAKHTDEAVVASATAKRSGEVGNVDLHYRSRVIRQPAGEARVDEDRGFVGKF